MPYVTRAERLNVSACNIMTTPGQLNYGIHKMIEAYFRQNPRSYTSYNDVIGVLECVKLELYRRLVGPYEDTKIVENGDIDIYALSK